MAPTTVTWGSNSGPPNSDRRATINFLTLSDTCSGGRAHTEYTSFLASLTCTSMEIERRKREKPRMPRRERNLIRMRRDLEEKYIQEYDWESRRRCHFNGFFFSVD
ncbi:hypothetical protein Hanom_Chr04g00356131 [Helianthus anomalus]